jgi:hypothetical protein
MSATMTPQFVADALIMAMTAKWRSVCTSSLLEKEAHAPLLPLPGVFLGFGKRHYHRQ